MAITLGGFAPARVVGIVRDFDSPEVWSAASIGKVSTDFREPARPILGSLWGLEEMWKRNILSAQLANNRRDSKKAWHSGDHGQFDSELIMEAS